MWHTLHQQLVVKGKSCADSFAVGYVVGEGESLQKVCSVFNCIFNQLILKYLGSSVEAKGILNYNLGLFLSLSHSVLCTLSCFGQSGLSK